MSNNELQNNDMILPGNIGTISVGNKVRDIKSVFKGKDGSVTITIGETKLEPVEPLRFIPNNKPVMDKYGRILIEAMKIKKSPSRTDIEKNYPKQ